MDDTNNNRMYAVIVKKSARKKICSNGVFWVKDAKSDYVAKRDRGLWKSKDDARSAITEPWEIVVEIQSDEI